MAIYFFFNKGTGRIKPKQKRASLYFSAIANTKINFANHKPHPRLYTKAVSLHACLVLDKHQLISFWHGNDRAITLSTWMVQGMLKFPSTWHIHLERDWSRLGRHNCVRDPKICCRQQQVCSSSILRVFWAWENSKFGSDGSVTITFFSWSLWWHRRWQHKCPHTPERKSKDKNGERNKKK